MPEVLLKNHFITAFLLIVAIPALAYEPDRNEHVRFGMPSQKGLLLYRKGYVAMYDTARKQPLWVSYKLSPEYLKNPVKPFSSFTPDPKVPQKYSAQNADYAKAFYSRARMAPMKDMLRSAETMMESYYLSNVCPMSKELYTGKWQELEQVVRDFVSDRRRDVWVISGPAFKPPKNGVIRAIGTGKVAVPTHFYKVILFQDSDGSFNAMGFLFDNREQSARLQEYMVTVSEIEELTGLVFLDRLPPEAGKLIKGRPVPQEKAVRFFN